MKTAGTSAPALTLMNATLPISHPAAMLSRGVRLMKTVEKDAEAAKEDSAT